MPPKRKLGTQDLVEEAKRRAHEKAGVPYTGQPKRAEHPLVPIFVGVDRENSQTREQFLWKYGAPGIDQPTVASKLCTELQLPNICERLLEEQINVGLRNYKHWKPSQGEKRVRLVVYVKHGDHALHDEVEWDLNNPNNTPELYALGVCSSLGLRGGWFQAVVRSLQAMLEDYHQDLLHRPSEVKLLPPVTSGSVVRAAPSATFPRVELYSEARDLEAQRRRARQARLSGAKMAPPQAGVKQELTPGQGPGASGTPGAPPGASPAAAPSLARPAPSGPPIKPDPGGPLAGTNPATPGPAMGGKTPPSLGNTPAPTLAGPGAPTMPPPGTSPGATGPAAAGAAVPPAAGAGAATPGGAAKGAWPSLTPAAAAGMAAPGAACPPGRAADTPDASRLGPGGAMVPYPAGTGTPAAALAGPGREAGGVARHCTSSGRGRPGEGTAGRCQGGTHPQAGGGGATGGTTGAAATGRHTGQAARLRSTWAAAAVAAAAAAAAAAIAAAIAAFAAAAAAARCSYCEAGVQWGGSCHWRAATLQ